MSIIDSQVQEQIVDVMRNLLYTISGIRTLQQDVEEKTSRGGGEGQVDENSYRQ